MQQQKDSVATIHNIQTGCLLTQFPEKQSMSRTTRPSSSPSREAFYIKKNRGGGGLMIYLNYERDNVSYVRKVNEFPGIREVVWVCVGVYVGVGGLGMPICPDMEISLSRTYHSKRRAGLRYMPPIRGERGNMERQGHSYLHFCQCNKAASRIPYPTCMLHVVLQPTGLQSCSICSNKRRDEQ